MVHALVLLMLFLMAFRTPLPLPGEEGVEVDMGMYNQGTGLVQPDKPEIPQQPTAPKPQHTEPTTKPEDIVTQETEEAPALPQQSVNPRALFQSRNRSQEGGSEGVTGQPGDQGNPNGLANIHQYEGQGGQGNGLGYDLGGRGAKSLQRPSQDFPEEGHVVVEIWVDREGNVVRTAIAKGTDITNTEMRNMALEAARRSKFVPEPSAPEEQRGTITYTFIQNH